MDSNTTSTRRLWASFSDYDRAGQAVAAFIDHGVPKDQIHLLVKDVPEAESVSKGKDALDKAEGGLTVTTPGDAGIGAEKGATVGLAVGVVAGLAALAIPGVGLVIGGGALATALAGAAGATVAGGLAGAVTGYLKDQGADDYVVREVGTWITEGRSVLDIEMDPDTMTQSDANALILKYGGSLLAMPSPAARP